MIFFFLPFFFWYATNWMFCKPWHQTDEIRSEKEFKDKTWSNSVEFSCKLLIFTYLYSQIFTYINVCRTSKCVWVYLFLPICVFSASRLIKHFSLFLRNRTLKFQIGIFSFIRKFPVKNGCYHTLDSFFFLLFNASFLSLLTQRYFFFFGRDF